MQWHMEALRELESQTAVQECQDPKLLLIDQLILWPDNGESNQMTWLKSYLCVISSELSRSLLMYLTHQDFPNKRIYPISFKSAVFQRSAWK